MKNFLIACLMIVTLNTAGQNNPLPEKYQRLPVGSIKPSGWLKTQMERDLAGFVGNLDRLVPDLVDDPIYGSGRLKKNSRAKELGNLKEGDAGGDEQYKWWNSETQSNWWDGYIRYALLLEDPQAGAKVRKYVDRMLATQDDDGYLGIYDRELRYGFKGENGELWSKTTLYRGLLAYYEVTGDSIVWRALVRAVDNVMQHYPINASQPFFAGNDFAGGVAHGLTFTDVLDRMYQLTGDRRYLDYAAFLYLNFSQNQSSEKDAQFPHILDPAYKLQSHGVHTYEHMRPLAVAAWATGNPELTGALKVYRERIASCTTPSGGAIGDEWIAGRTADATTTGYEYCSLHELMDSYSAVFQKSGDLPAAEAIETIFYNAAQGSRNPDHSCIAYLKTDNSYEMLGTKNGEKEPGRNQTRYKYSPVHQDVAVCCVPNAGRISPYFLQSCWLKEGTNTLVAPVLGPTILNTTLQNIPIRIEERTEYPYSDRIVFRITADQAVSFLLKVRKPSWASSVVTREKYRTEEGFLLFDCSCPGQKEIAIEFKAEIRVIEDANHEMQFSRGALVYALPIAGTERRGKIYSPGFEDLYYAADDTVRYGFIRDHNAVFQDGTLRVNLENKATHRVETFTLLPIGKTILRQATFQ